MKHLINSALDWRNGQPYSTLFDDVYFSVDPENPQQGIDETHYVFLQHNQLELRFNNLTNSSFTIAETGFGTGLNFLSTCQLWRATAPKTAELKFISIEKYPLSLIEIQQAHALWPKLSIESQAFIALYSDAKREIISIKLFENVNLIIYLGDVNDVLPKVNFEIDAWFLDGFSPAKNPQMWQQTLFDEMARLSHAQTTFATFTSAGFVRRGLEAAGFKVQKNPGFGKKREMLSGYFAKKCDESSAKY